MAMSETRLFKQTNDTLLQKFLFTFDHSYRDRDIEYSIVLGEQKYSSWISNYATDLEIIRHDLESFVFHKKTTLELFFKDSPTIINLRTERLLNPQKESALGTGSTWEEVLHISIKPNSFQAPTDSVISGYCSLIDGIEAIYTAFLQCALTLWPRKGDSGESCWPNREAFYNIIKSPIIEDFIAGREYDPYAPQRRYAPVDIVMSISPDLYSSTQNDFISVGDDIFDDTFSVFDSNDNTVQEIIVPGIDNWLEEYRDATDFADTTTSSDFDYREWHKRGIAFAQEIRNKMIDNSDLWYHSPYEDKNSVVLRPKLILKKTTK